MESIGDYEYNTKDIIGHGAFAVVFKGREKKVSDCIQKYQLAFNIFKFLESFKHCCYKMHHQEEYRKTKSSRQRNKNSTGLYNSF